LWNRYKCLDGRAEFDLGQAFDSTRAGSTRHGEFAAEMDGELMCGSRCHVQVIDEIMSIGHPAAGIDDPDSASTSQRGDCGLILAP
jgi:hypothetical protein